MSAPELVGGQIVGARYTIHRERARTDLTITYEAITAPNRHVELELLTPQLRERGDLEECMQYAMQVTNELPSSLVLHVLEVGIDQGTGAPFVATDLSVTPSLAELVQLCPLAAPEVVSFLGNLATALEAVHARGLVHLTLSPNNIFVGTAPRFEVRLGEIGARFVLGMAGFDPRWAAPECASDPQISCDVFTAGLVALFAASGTTLGDRSAAALRRPATALARETGTPVDARLDAALAGALDPDPAKRYRSVRELSDAVAHALGCAAPRASLANTPDVVSPPALVTANPPWTAAVEERMPPDPVASAVVAPPTEMGFGSPQTGPALVDSSSLHEPAIAALRRSKNVRMAVLGGAIVAAFGAIVSVVWMLAFKRDATPSASASASSAPLFDASSAAGGSVAEAPQAPRAAQAPPAPAPIAPSARPAEAPPSKAGSEARAAAPVVPVDDANAGKLMVICTPECASVTIDGQPFTSFPAAFAPGDHSVTARRGLHAPQTQTVALKNGEERTVSFIFWATTRPAAPKKPCGKFLERCN